MENSKQRIKEIETEIAEYKMLIAETSVAQNIKDFSIVEIADLEKEMLCIKQSKKVLKTKKIGDWFITSSGDRYQIINMSRLTFTYGKETGPSQVIGIEQALSCFADGTWKIDAPALINDNWEGDFVEMVNGEWVKIEKRTTPYKRSDKYSNKIYKVD